MTIGPRRPITRLLGRFILVDVLLDRSARPVLLFAAGSVTFGAALFHAIEGWGWLDSFYFAVITTTTIGYGDLAPKTDLGKLVTIFFALNGIAILLMLLEHIRRVRTPVHLRPGGDD